MVYFILLVMSALIILMELFVFKLDKKVTKLTEKIYEIEVNRSIELLKTKSEPKEKPKAEVKLTKEEKDKQERMKQAFDNLMNYDERIARKIRK